MSFHTISMTRLILQSKMLRSLMCAQNAPLFTTKHQANVQNAYLIL